MAAKLGLSLFAVLIAAQVIASSGSPCYCGVPLPPPQCSEPCGPVSLPNPLPITFPGTSACPPTAPVQYPPITIAPPPPAGYPNLPPLVSPNPLSIPLPLPSVIPVGKLCVCKAVQLQPSLVPVTKPCRQVQICPPAQPATVIPGFCL